MFGSLKIGDREPKLPRCGYAAVYLNVPSENKLRALLETKGSLVATNPGGIEWLVKALHPSDPVTTAMGVPDETSFPTVTIAYQTTHKISCPAGVTDNWDLNIDCVPDHIQPISYTVWTGGAYNSNGFVLNPMLGGVSYSEKFGSWIKLKPVRHRLMYYGVTAVQDASALANQGTVVACQHSVDPDVFNVVGAIAVLPPAQKTAQKPPSAAPLIPVACSKHCRAFPLAVMPSYDQAMGMPNAMMGPAKEGVYLPLRMTETSQKWQGVQDLSFVGVNITAGGDYFGDPDYRIWTESVLPDVAGYAPPYNSVRSAYTNDSGLPRGDLIYGPANGQWGYIGFAGLSKDASIALTVRWGLEVQVLPSSILAPYQKSSPEYDPQALAAYFHISRQLKDAYPADYNDLAKLWSVIKSAAHAATPFLAGLGPYGQVAAAAIPAAIGIVDGVSARFSRDKGGAAARERAQETVKQAVARPAKRVILTKKKKQPKTRTARAVQYVNSDGRVVTMKK